MDMNEDLIPEPQAARKALAGVADIQRRNAHALSAHVAAPHFILWGLVWSIGFLGSHFFPSIRVGIWLAGVGLGNFAMIWILMRQLSRGPLIAPDSRPGTLLWIWIPLALALFFLLGARDGDRLLAYLCLTFVGIPTLMTGIWSRSRFIAWTGGLVVAICLRGFLLAGEPSFYLWMSWAGIILLVSGWRARRKWMIPNV